MNHEYGFVCTEVPLYGSLSMTESKNQLNYFNKTLEQFDVNNFEEKIINTSFWPVAILKFYLH